MVRLALFILFLLLPSLALAEEWELLDVQGDIDSKVLSDADAQKRITSGSGGSAKAFKRGEVLIAILPKSSLSLGERVEFIRGRFLLDTAKGESLAFDVPETESIEIEGRATIYLEDEGLKIGLFDGSVLQSQEFSIEADRKLCYLFENGEFIEAKESSCLDLAPKNSEQLSKPFDFEIAPELESVRKSAKQRETGDDGTDDRASAGESICLESSGPGSGAADISGDRSDVEVEQGKARLRVRVQWGQ